MTSIFFKPRSEKIKLLKHIFAKHIRGINCFEIVCWYVIRAMFTNDRTEEVGLGLDMLNKQNWGKPSTVNTYL